MAYLLRMPEIAANATEAVLSAWPLPANARFAAGDAIATVETDKAVVDVPAEAGGVLLRTLVEPGRSVSVGTAIAVLAEPDEIVDDVDTLVERLTADAPAAAVSRGVGADAVVSAGVGAVVSAGVGDAVSPGAGDAVPSGDVPGAPVRVFASPLARRVAKEHNLAVEEIRGTGPGGRIVRDDVHRAVAARQRVATPIPSPTPPPTPPAQPPAPPAQPSTLPARPPAFHDVAHSAMRRAIAARLVEGVRTTPVFTIRGSAHLDALLALRAEVNSGSGTDGGTSVSVTDFIVAAAARAHVAVPEMNVIWTPDAVRSFHTVDIALAVATDTGLVTPVLRDVPAKTLSALAAASADLVTRARSGALRQHELEGGTLTVTNLGPFGVEDFTAVINPPQSAILAVGAARPEAVVSGGELGVATLMRVTLTVDHRPVDGAIAARWMAAFLALLEAPLRILV
jgi:pyruvate dehydrogenase E2 component (dihydrolipoamide acetyltransferase)